MPFSTILCISKARLLFHVTEQHRSQAKGEERCISKEEAANCDGIRYGTKYSSFASTIECDCLRSSIAKGETPSFVVLCPRELLALLGCLTLVPLVANSYSSETTYVHCIKIGTEQLPNEAFFNSQRHTKR